MPGTPDFEKYKQQIFIIKEVILNDGKSLCLYYPVFGKSDEKDCKGRVQVDSSGNPHNYRLRSGADIKDTVLQMWSRSQRYLHHSEWDEREESISVCVPVKEIQHRTMASSQEQEETEDESWQWKGNGTEDGSEVTDAEAFESGCIRLQIRNGNRVLSRPLPLKECITFEELCDQAFQNQEASAAQSNILGSLSRITRALGEKEQQDGTEDKWYSYAHYVDRDYLQGSGTAEKVFTDKRVWVDDWLLPDGALPEYQRIVYPEYWQEQQAKKGKGRGRTVQGKSCAHPPQVHGAGRGNEANGLGRTGNNNNSNKKSASPQEQTVKGGKGQTKGRGKRP